MVSARVAPMATLMLDAVDNREILVAKGEVTVRTLTAGVTLTQGQRMDLSSQFPTMLLNDSAFDVEVILLTMLGAVAPARATLPAPAQVFEITAPAALAAVSAAQPRETSMAIYA